MQEKQLELAKQQLKQEVRPLDKSTKAATVAKKRSTNPKQMGTAISKNST